LEKQVIVILDEKMRLFPTSLDRLTFYIHKLQLTPRGCLDFGNWKSIFDLTT